MLRSRGQVAYHLGKIKHLQTSAAAVPNGLDVTYPSHNNDTHTIYNPLETFISTLPACYFSIFRILSSKYHFRTGQAVFPTIESDYDLGQWANGGGPENKLREISFECTIESSSSAQEFEKLKAMTENHCPVYQMMNAAGITIKANVTQVPI